jgi:hypothetical protein
MVWVSLTKFDLEAEKRNSDSMEDEWTKKQNMKRQLEDEEHYSTDE